MKRPRDASGERQRMRLDRQKGARSRRALCTLWGFESERQRRKCEMWVGIFPLRQSSFFPGESFGSLTIERTTTRACRCSPFGYTLSLFYLKSYPFHVEALWPEKKICLEGPIPRVDSFPFPWLKECPVVIIASLYCLPCIRSFVWILPIALQGRNWPHIIDEAGKV